MVKLFIDAGHGGSDSGATGNGLREKDLTLTISKRIASLLKDYYVDVKLSRTIDVTLSLTQRTDMANRWGADYLLSIHINAGGGTGYEDYIYNGKLNAVTEAFRNNVHEEITKLKIWHNRGKKQANFHMLRKSRASAMLTENGFIDTKVDADKLRSNDFLDKVAQAHVNGLIEALSLKRKVVEKPTPKVDKDIFYRVIAGSYNDRENAEAQVDRLKKLGIKGLFIDVFKSG